MLFVWPSIDFFHDSVLSFDQLKLDIDFTKFVKTVIFSFSIVRIYLSEAKICVFDIINVKCDGVVEIVFENAVRRLNEFSKNIKLDFFSLDHGAQADDLAHLIMVSGHFLALFIFMVLQDRLISKSCLYIPDHSFANLFLFKHEIEPLNLVILRPEFHVYLIGNIISGMSFLSATDKWWMEIRVIQIVHRHLHFVLMFTMVGFVIIVSKDYT